jgi:hypothetical protein
MITAHGEGDPVRYYGSQEVRVNRTKVRKVS